MSKNRKPSQAALLVPPALIAALAAGITIVLAAGMTISQGANWTLAFITGAVGCIAALVAILAVRATSLQR